MTPAQLPAQIIVMAATWALASCAVPSATTSSSSVAPPNMGGEAAIAVTKAALRHLGAQGLGCIDPDVRSKTNASDSHGRTWYSLEGGTPRQLTDQEAASVDRAALTAGATVQYITRIEAAWLPERFTVDQPSCDVSIDSPIFGGDYAFVDTRAIAHMSGNGFLIALRKEGGEWRVVAHRQSLMVMM